MSNDFDSSFQFIIKLSQLQSSNLFTFQMKTFVPLLLILCISYRNVNSFRFLAILPVTSKSHYYIGHNLMKGLAEDGHEVTVISPFKANEQIKNYNEVFLEHSWEISRKSKRFYISFVEKNITYLLFIVRFNQHWQRIISKKLR